MEQQKESQMVYIKDLLFTVLYRWKAVLAVTLVMALLLGGLGLILGSGAMSVEDAQKLEIYETQKLAMDQRITSLQKTVQERQLYLEDALLMQLDPYNHYEAQLTVSVQVQGDETGFVSAFAAQALLEAYRSVLTEESLLEQLAQILQQPSRYVSELIGATVPAIGTDTVTFTVKCNDGQTAAALAEAVKVHLEQYQGQIAQDLEPHTLSVLKSTAFATADTALAESQRVEMVRLADMITALTDARNKRTALVRPDVADGASKVKNTVILAVVGAFAGVFIMVCLLWIGHIGSGKVYSGRTLSNRTGVKVLGCLDSGSKRGPFQRWLRKLEGRADSADAALVATDIALRTDAKKLLVIGSGSEAVRKALAAALKQAIPQAEIAEAASVLCCPEALKALAVCEAVVLVEVCGSSRYQSIRQQTEKIEDYGKQLVGCVLVDG